jgi:hypothetical protein
MAFSHIGEIKAPNDLVSVLRDKGWIQIDADEHPPLGYVTPSARAYLAVMRGFRASKEKLLSSSERAVLDAAYAACDGDIAKTFLAHTVAENAGIAIIKDLITVLTAIESKGYLASLPPVIPKSGPLYNLTFEGKGLVEEQFLEDAVDNAKSAQTTSVTNNITHSTVGSLVVGNDNTTNVAQTVGVKVQEILELLDRTKSHLAALPVADQQEAEEQIEHIKDEVKTGNPAWSKIKTYSRVLLQITGGIIKFQNDLAAVLDKLGIEKHLIMQLFHAAK